MKTFVRPPVTAERVGETCLLIGAGVGFLESFLPSWRVLGSNPNSIFSFGTLFLLGNFAIAGVALSTITRRRRPVFAGGFGYSFGFVMSLALSWIVRNGGGAFLAPGVMMGLCGFGVIAGAVGGGLALALQALGNDLFCSVVVQDGTLCPDCGYSLRVAGHARCSECGRDASAPSARRATLGRAVAFVYRRARAFSLIAILLALVMFVRQHVAVVRPMQAFQSRFQAAAVPSLSGSMYGDDFYRDGTSWPAQGAAEALPQDPTKLLLVMYAPGALRQPIMQIRLQWQLPVAGPPLFFDGMPAIVCNLTAEQAEQVVANGVPETLADALLAAAKDACWPASPPLIGPGGIVQSSSGPAEVVVLPADAHFAGDAASLD